MKSIDPYNKRKNENNNNDEELLKTLRSTKYFRLKDKEYTIRAQKRNSINVYLEKPKYQKTKRTNTMSNDEIRSLTKEYRKLTDQQIDEMREMFDMFDCLGDGQISVMELKNELNNLCLEVDDKVCKKMISMVDMDNKGYIYFGEFVGMCIDLNLINPISHPSYKLSTDELFHIFDYNDDGRLTLEEIQKRILTITGERFSQDNILKMLKIIDTDNDGVVTIDEFIEIVKIAEN